MRRGRVAFVLLALVCSLAAVTGAEAAPPPPAPFAFLAGCNATIDTNFVNNFGSLIRLDDDLDCPGDAITISASSVDLDLGGHIVKGDDNAANEGDFGVTLSGNSNTVHNGTITGFDRALEVDGNSNTMKDLNLFDSQIDTALFAGDSNTYQGNISARGGALLLNATASGNTVQGSVLYDDDIVSSAGDNNQVLNNNIYDGTINFAVGSDGSNGNTISNNQIIGAQGAGISVSGDTSDANTVTDNFIQGSTSDGIFISDADLTIITGNTTVGNTGSGLELAGSAQTTNIANNDAGGNLVDGITMSSTSTGASVSGNQVHSNGGNGVNAATGAAPAFDDNIADFNGFTNGIQGLDNLGIKSSDGTTTNGNEANGNDVTTAGSAQCSNTLCSPNGTPTNFPPALTACGATGSVNLYNPLDCAGLALQTLSNGVTLTLRTIFIRGSAAGLELGNGVDGVTVSGGTIVGGNTGIFASGNTTNSTIADTVVASPNANGVSFPDSGYVGDTLTNIISTGSVGNGFLLAGIDQSQLELLTSVGNLRGMWIVSNNSNISETNTIEEGEFDGNAGDGLLLDDGRSNVIQNNHFRGNAGDGIQLEQDTGSPDSNKIQENDVTGNEGNGIYLNAGTKNQIKKNVITASRNQAGIYLDDIGVTKNSISGNTISGQFQYGIYTSSLTTKNNISKNKIFDNGQDGIFFEDPANGKVIKNKTDHNGFVNGSDGSGLGILIGTGAKGCGNKGKNNDDPDQFVPKKLKKKC